MKLLRLALLALLFPATALSQTAAPPRSNESVSVPSGAIQADKPAAVSSGTTPATTANPSSASTDSAPAPSVAPSALPERPSVHSSSLSVDAEALHSLRVPEKPTGPRGFIPGAQRDGRKKLWLGLSLAQHGAAAFDSYATREVISSGSGREMDPLLRPFAGSAALYPVMQVGPTLLDYLGLRMMHSQRSWVRHVWWVPQAAATAGFVYAGAHNLSMVHSGLSATSH